MRLKFRALSLLLLVLCVGVAGVGCSSNEPMFGEKAGKFADDSYITSAVKTKLLGDTGLKAFSIHVTTKAQVVTLEGALPSQALVDEAIRVTKSVGGVKDVVSQLTIKSE